MARRPDLAASDPLRMLRSLALRATPSALLPNPTEPGRVGPTVSGMVGLLDRRNLRHARLRTWDGAGLLVCGEDDAEILDAETARACIQALREAASLAASAPAGFGSFTAMGLAACVEITQCHDGARAFLHLAPPDGTLGDPLLEAVAEADADALRDLHGMSVAPEELLSLRRGGRWPDMPNLLVRHCDIALLAVDRRLAIAGQLLSLLVQALTQALRAGRWRLALEPMAECTRYCRRFQATGSPGFLFDVRGAAVRDVLDACWLAASPSTTQCLRAAGRAGAPLLSLETA